MTARDVVLCLSLYLFGVTHSRCLLACMRLPDCDSGLRVVADDDCHCGRSVAIPTRAAANTTFTAATAQTVALASSAQAARQTRSDAVGVVHARRLALRTPPSATATAMRRHTARPTCTEALHVVKCTRASLGANTSSHASSGSVLLCSPLLRYALLRAHTQMQTALTGCTRVSDSSAFNAQRHLIGQASQCVCNKTRRETNCSQISA